MERCVFVTLWRVGLYALAGVGLTLCSVSPAEAQYPSHNVSLHAQLDLNQLGSPNGGNDCWGYVAPSGREYALMGVQNALVVVEITTPSSPNIIGTISHSASLWGDIKTYQTYAYVSNESGGGIDIVDLSNVDSGVVTLVQRMTTGGVADVHNIAIDTTSGFLYLAIGNINGGRLVAYDLSNPASPTLAGQMSSAAGGSPLHDAQIVTFTSGPNIGRQICFGSAQGSGFDIIDVTNKSNMFRLSRSTYPGLSYCHQSWMSADGRYVYVNDETDGINATVVFDIANLNNPTLANIYNSGVSAADHNLYVHNGFIYEAEYHAGVRIFCASDPVAPIQTGWFDTYPANDGAGFAGAWSIYPFFPSGTLIVSDTARGLFILDPSAALTAGALLFNFPNGRPDLINPLGGTTVRIDIAGACGGAVQPGSPMLHYDVGGGFVSTPLQLVSPGVFDAVFPAAPCTTVVDWYVSAQLTNGATETSPSNAPSFAYSATAAVGRNEVLNLNFQAAPGWAVTGTATDGQWNRGVPVACNRGDPSADFDGSGQCMLTDNSAANGCNSDVDGGATILTTSSFNVSGLNDPYVGYARWFTNTFGGSPEQDVMVVEASDDNGASWVLLETVGPTSATHPEVAGGWVQKQFQISAFIGLTAQVRFRFTASDLGSGSVVEAGLDAFRIFEFDCNAPVVCTKGDVNDDQAVNGLDMTLFVDTLVTGGTPGTLAFCATDMDDDGVLEVGDDAGLFVDCLLGLGCP